MTKGKKNYYERREGKKTIRVRNRKRKLAEKRTKKGKEKKQRDCQFQKGLTSSPLSFHFYIASMPRQTAVL